MCFPQPHSVGMMSVIPAAMATALANVLHHASVYFTAEARASGLWLLYRSMIFLWLPSLSLHPM